MARTVRTSCRWRAQAPIKGDTMSGGPITTTTTDTPKIRMIKAAMAVVGPMQQPHFAKYEEIMGVVSPNEDFRRDLLIRSALLMCNSMLQADEIEYERKNRTRRLQWARNRKTEASQMREKIRAAYDAPGADKHALHDFNFQAFLEEADAQERLNATEAEKGKRGRRVKEADYEFVLRIAEIYERTAGKRPTVVTTNQGYTGPFVDLAKAIHRDMRDVFRGIGYPEIANTLSVNIGRYAKKVLSAQRDRGKG